MSADTEPFLSPDMITFNDAKEAKHAFACGHLPWQSRDRAFMLLTEGRVVRGHRRVRILDVDSIDSSGRPTYTVIDDENVVCTAAEGSLYNEEGLFGTPNAPTAYAQMLQERMRRDRVRALTTEPWSFEITLTMAPPPKGRKGR